jgi:hypothetical protein
MKKFFLIFSIMLILVFLIVNLTSCWFYAPFGSARLDPDWGSAYDEALKQQASESISAAEESQAKADESVAESISKKIEAQDQEKNSLTSTSESTSEINTSISEPNISNGTITFKGDVDGAPLTLIINLDTGAVSGSTSFYNNDKLIGETTYEGTITGTVDLKTNKITASCSYNGTTGGQAYSGSYDMIGVLNSDYSSAKGTAEDANETHNWSATAQK